MTHTGEVPAALDGQRLDRVVAMMTGCSRSEATRWIDQGLVRVGDEVATDRSLRLGLGDAIAVDRPVQVDERPLADDRIAFDVVHADDDLLVVNKPAGLVVHPGSGHSSGTLVNGLVARFPEIAEVGEADRPGIVHRLDKGTSGLMLVARTPVAYAALVEALSSRTVHREYRALVHGHPEAPRGVVDAPIGRSSRDATKMAVVASGKVARTHYRVLDVFDEPVRVALLSCELETGRTHQIRVHLAAIGHSVVGDTRYGGGGRALGITRPFLHAHTLRFVHPVSGAEMAFSVDLPDDLTAVLARLER